MEPSMQNKRNEYIIASTKLDDLNGFMDEKSNVQLLTFGSSSVLPDASVKGDSLYELRRPWRVFAADSISILVPTNI
jgi:hypothetical protein